MPSLQVSNALHERSTGAEVNTVDHPGGLVLHSMPKTATCTSTCMHSNPSRSCWTICVV